MVQKNDDSSVRIGRSEDVIATLKELENEIVTVSVSSLGLVRQGFHTQMSVEGVLDVHPSGEGYYRVQGEDGFTYFSSSDVFAITQSDNVVVHIGISFEGSPFDALSEILFHMNNIGFEDDVQEAIRQILEAKEEGDH